MTAPRNDKSRTTRAGLVQSATDLFVECGYGGVSVRDLARRTQVTSGAIYGHFRSKADLLVAAISDHIAFDLDQPSRGQPGFRAAITRQWRSYRSRADLRALLVEGAAAARVDPQVQTQLHQLQAAQLAEWKQAYHEIQEVEGIDPDVNMDTVLTMLWATELGLGILEAWQIELPTPSAWAELAERIISALEMPRRR